MPPDAAPESPAPAKAGFRVWPHGLFVAFGLFFLCLAALIFSALRSPDQLVTADYYEQELRHQQKLDRQQRAERLSPPVTVVTDTARQELVITLPADQVRQGVKGQIQFYRPSTVALDRQLELLPDPQGRQSVDLRELKSGLWRVRLEWTAGDLGYSLDRRVEVPKRPG